MAFGWGLGWPPHRNPILILKTGTLTPTRLVSHQQPPSAILRFGAKHSNPVVALEELRESYHSRNICDMRRPISTIASQYPFISYEHIKQDKEGETRIGLDEDLDTLVDRAYQAMVKVTALMGDEKCAAIATHSVFLFALTNGVLEFEDPEDKRAGYFETGELRTFEIDVI